MHTVTWLRGVEFRSLNGSEIATRVVEAVRQRDQAMRAIDRATTGIDSIELRVPGAGTEPAY